MFLDGIISYFQAFVPDNANAVSKGEHIFADNGVQYEGIHSPL
jgi:hypothetical protein